MKRSRDAEPWAPKPFNFVEPPSITEIEKTVQSLPPGWKQSLRQVYRTWPPLPKKRFDRLLAVARQSQPEDIAVVMAYVAVSASLLAAAGVVVPRGQWAKILRHATTTTASPRKDE